MENKIINGILVESPEELRKLRDSLEKNYWKNVFITIFKDWRLYLMLVPMILVFFFWRYMPMYELLAAFKFPDPSITVVSKQDFVGFANFKNLMFGADAVKFWQAFRNTFMLSFYGLLCGFPMPIILALFFNEVKSDVFRSVLQIFTYLPKFVSLVVITSLVTLLLRGGTEQGSGMEPGIVAKFLEAIGIIKEGEAFKGMMYSPRYFRAMYQVSGIWETAGYGSIVYFAAIVGISPTSYEAARIDGANKFAQIRYVVLPGILSTITIMLILRIGELLTVGYEKVILLYNSKTYSTADVVSTYVARLGGLEAGGAGRAGDAISGEMFNALLSMLLVMGANFISKRASDVSLY